ncbi:MAG TPA: IS66 family transposase zinc-finger binding domain-containing protein [Candidatus Bathyarchaeia archaeon]|nr:IS66 family transposase zinc-finger binding domain-containing protein [Dongiaceae bacterium]HVP49997.1 IS66 family transposase zinc-finger binding domain-containing protein [Candidatus Bathyarchaeia archaeon]
MTLNRKRPVAQAFSDPVPVTKPARQALPERLPREVKTYSPQEQVCACGGRLRPLGEDVSELLEYVPARFKVMRYVRPKLSCADCERIVQAPAPSRPIERGLGRTRSAGSYVSREVRG